MAPNVLVVLVDDLGVEMLQAYDAVNAWPGSASEALASGFYASTPRIDAVAQQGILFTNARALPLCSPTRAGLVTGRYGFRTGVGDLVEESRVSNTFTELGVDIGGLFPRARREYVIAELATSVGYRSAFFGKWHLSMLGPNDTGISCGNNVATGNLPNGTPFDGTGWAHLDGVGKWNEWFAVLANPNVDPQPYFLCDPERVEDGSYGVPTPPRDPGEHSPDGGWYGRSSADLDPVIYNGAAQYADKVKVDRALGWMNSGGSQPFVCYLFFNLIHSPFHDPRAAGYAVRDVYTRVIDSNIPEGKKRWAYQMAMLEAFDQEFGRLLDGLSPAVRARTIVILASDNGSQNTLASARDDLHLDIGETYGFLADNGRFKGSVWEGGIRVPLIVKGPAAVVKGAPRESPHLVDLHVDIFETCLDVMNADYPSVATDGRMRDGLSFLPVLGQPALAYGAHQRQFGFSHRFRPNGDGDDPTARREDDWAFVKHVSGDGTYKLVHRMDSGNELFRIRDDQGLITPSEDPFERHPLPHGPVYDQLLDAANLLLASEYQSP